MKIRFYVLSFILTSFLLSCDETPTKYEEYGNALGTTYSVNYYAEKDLNIKPKFDSIFEVINQSLSTYRPTSDISKLNQGNNIEVDEHFVTVFKVAHKIFQKTNGYFDPSAGILVNAYGFGPEKYNLKMSPKVIDSLMNFVGFNQFELDDHHVKTDLQSFYLDFNAIAKGYAVDVLSDFLKNKSINHFFVEVGGEVVAQGKDLEQDKIWNFGIETPDENNTSRQLSYAVSIENKALATSGNYRKFKIDPITKQKYVHTINPITGQASKSNVLSASVVAENCMIADAYATGFMAMGFDEAKSIIEKENISALLIYVDEENELQTYISEELEDIVSSL